jgi:hypothetical protein
LKEKLVHLEGVITASKWDDWDSITGIILQSNDEKEYLIDLETGLGFELMRYVQSYVEIHGFIQEDEEDNDESLLTVSSYDILE